MLPSPIWNSWAEMLIQCLQIEPCGHAWKNLYTNIDKTIVMDIRRLFDFCLGYAYLPSNIYFQHIIWKGDETNFSSSHNTYFYTNTNNKSAFLILKTIPSLSQHIAVE